MASSLEEPVAAQLQLNSNNEASNQAAQGSQPPAAPGFVNYSRQMDFAPQNVRAKVWLRDHDDTFRQLDDLREQGWSSPDADEFFEKERMAANQKTGDTEDRYNRQFNKISKELRTMGAFEVLGNNPSELSSLNLCMAPGAYTAAILEQYPNASVCGITLPVESGGHRMMIPYGSADSRVDVEFMDITMLPEEFLDCAVNIRASHPGAAKFVSQSPFAGKSFGLVLCDGNLVPGQGGAGKKAGLEPVRLLTAQLVFGMNRIMSGGTFVILLHKADAFHTIELLKDFCSISESVTLFKPKTAHQKKASFYMVAKGVHSSGSEAHGCVAKWRACWTRATFGGVDQTGLQAVTPTTADVDALLAEFGPKLIAMSQDVWKIQAEALKKALDKKFKYPGTRHGMQSKAPNSSGHGSIPRYTAPGRRAATGGSSSEPFGPRHQVSSIMPPNENEPQRKAYNHPSKGKGKDTPVGLGWHQSPLTDKQKEIANASSWRPGV
ncbi:MAG: hypothetical protein Q9184_006844 [Pyrenodesmia sp. 2 TL-2023]